MTSPDRDGKIFVGKGASDAYLALALANRHGLVTGATGTGKTVSLQVLAEGFRARACLCSPPISKAISRGSRRAAGTLENYYFGATYDLLLYDLTSTYLGKAKWSKPPKPNTATVATDAPTAARSSSPWS